MGKSISKDKPLAYFGHGSDDPEGLKKLWMAVVIRAAQDLGEPIYRRSARHWFLSHSQRVGSFEWICLHTGLNERLIRDAILNGTVKARNAGKEG